MFMTFDRGHIWTQMCPLNKMGFAALFVVHAAVATRRARTETAVGRRLLAEPPVVSALPESAATSAPTRTDGRAGTLLSLIVLALWLPSAQPRGPFRLLARPG